MKRFDLALELCKKGPCDPRTLTRAARDYAEKEPAFAYGVGMAALHWLLQGYGYEISTTDVWAAYHETMKAARAAGKVDEAESVLSEAVQLGMTRKDWSAGVLAGIMRRG